MLMVMTMMTMMVTIMMEDNDDDTNGDGYDDDNGDHGVRAPTFGAILKCEVSSSAAHTHQVPILPQLMDRDQASALSLYRALLSGPVHTASACCI